jgi:hypothetical protein
MQKRSPIRFRYLSLIFTVLLSMVLSGCDFDSIKNFDFNFDFLKRGKAAEVPVLPTTLAEGMTLDEVNELLGASSGEINIGDNTSYLYNGIVLSFEGDILVMPKADVLARAKKRIYERQHPVEE